MSTFERHNSDGSTYVARTRRTIAGTEVLVRHDRIPGAGGAMLVIDGHVHLVMRQQLVPVRHPAYERASTEHDAVRVALAFFGDSYEASVKHAAEEGIPVADCFGPVPGDVRQ